MKRIIETTQHHTAAGLGLAALVVAAATVALFAQPQTTPSGNPERMETQSSQSAQTPETIIKDWPERARSIARTMIEKYGDPDRISDDVMVWYNNSPWQKTVVYRKAWPHSIMMRDKDYLEQTIGYQVPNDKVNELKRFDKRLDIIQTSGELSSRSESESMNILALNLADEIVHDRRSVEEARDFYRETERLTRSGKSSKYVEGLLFDARISTNSRRYEPEDVEMRE